jgi:serine/threonine kinase PknH
VQGTPFGRYRLVELLGRGGVGEVWRAFDPVTDRVVALRMLPANCPVDHGFQLRFRREARAAAGLNEPHVVPIHDFGEIEGRLFVTMRLIKGCDLQDVLEDGPLPPGRAVWIIEQIASALHAAHEVGLVHSDVKPSSILIAADDFAYLTDFGIATRKTGLANTGAAMGANWAYMAPERFRAGKADARADVYGLACVLYQLLTGQLPFPDEGLDQLAAAHMSKPPPRPSRMQCGVPPAMDRVIATGMAKEPYRRYSTTKHLAKAARGALATPTRQPTSWVSPLSHATPTPRSAKRSPRGNIVADTPSRAKLGTDSGPTGSGKHRHQARHASRNNRVSTAPTSTTAASPVVQPLSKRTRVAFGAITVVAVAALVAGIIVMGHSAFRGSSGSPTFTESAGTVAPPVGEDVLDRLLLSADQVNAIIGATATPVTGIRNSFYDGAAIAPKECLALAGPAEAQVYSGSGETAVRADRLQNGGDNFTDLVLQAVVRFPSAADAGAFFNASAQQWVVCHQYTDSQNELQWTSGQVNSANGTLSAITTAQNASPSGWGCERALAAANNVIIDVDACSANPNNSAVTLAHRIAAKVPTT